MRYRKSGGNEAVHTLNSTAVATSRALVAIMEQYQTDDGSVIVPDVLVPAMRGKDPASETIAFDFRYPFSIYITLNFRSVLKP